MNEQPPVRQQIEQLQGISQQQQKNIELLLLRTNQQQQILDQYRVEIYNGELRTNFLIKLLEERGVFVKEEFEKRFPQYLKNEVGVIDAAGIMDGSLKITFYN